MGYAVACAGAGFAAGAGVGELAAGVGVVCGELAGALVGLL